MGLDLSRLKIFYYVAREKNISKAAKLLGIAQSTLSRSVAEFEHEIDAQLIVRASRGINLTAQGEQVYTFVKRVLQDVDLFEKNFQEKNDEIEGELIIETTPFLGTEWLIPKLKGFLENNPKLKTRLLLKTDNVGLYDSDVIIRPFIPNHPNLTQVPLFSFKLKLFASRSYLKKFGTPKTPQDLDNHRLITFRDETYPYGDVTWILRVGRNADQPLREAYMDVNLSSGMFQSAMQGLGITSLPDFPSILNSNLVEVLPNVGSSEITIYCIFPEERLNSKKITQLAEYLSN